MKKRIVFITDCVDIAYSELRGTVLEIIKDSDIQIEPVAEVVPFSIINGDFVLKLMANAYPEGTIFSIILNPMKDRPERLLGKTKHKNIYFLGANTGVFTSFIEQFGIEELYELKDPGFSPFGGKYVHAPALAKIAMGTPLSQLGTTFPIEKVLKLNNPSGTIVHIDNFGLMKFIGESLNFFDGDKIEIQIGDKILNGVFTKRMMSRDTGEWTIYPSSSFNYLELGKVREDAAKILNAKIGDIINFRKIN